MKLSDYTKIIRFVGSTLIQDYISTGHVQTGINGPYDDPETEVRYLAHLIVIASVECLKYGKEDYRSLVSKMGNQLLSMKQENGLYKMRQKSGKDECNGTIGHAWLVEGLLYVYKVTGNEKFIDESERIFMMHGFNQKLCLWGRPLMGCDDNAIDYTFNHQLWYAASLAEFLQVRYNANLKKQLDSFCKNLPHTITINRIGRIGHCIYKRVLALSAVKIKIVRIRDLIRELTGIPNFKYKEVGYHSFNLMALARLYKVVGCILFYKTSRFTKTLKFINENYKNELIKDNIKDNGTSYGNTLSNLEKSINIYGYPYNVPGFELMYCSIVWPEYLPSKLVVSILKEQFNQTWDNTINIFGEKCHDRINVNYRIYEYYRYLELADNEL